MIDFTVITPTWNRLAILERFFPALLSNTPWDRGELVVVEQGSDPETADFVVQQAAKVRRSVIFKLEENVGIPRAWNLGLRVSSGKMIVCLGSDHAVPVGWIDELLYVLKFPKAGCASIPSDALIEAGYLGEEVRAENGVIAVPSLHNSNVGAMMAFMRSTHKRLGYFNEEYGLYGEEDADWGARIAVCGLLNMYSARLQCKNLDVKESPEEREWKNAGMEERMRKRQRRCWEYSSGCREVYIPWQGPEDHVP